MKIRISQLRLRLDDDQMPLEAVAARALRVKPDMIRTVKLLRKSVDARDKGDVHFKLTLEVETDRPVRLPRNAEAIDAAPKPADVRDKGDVHIRLTQEAGIDRPVRLPRNAEAIDAAPKPADVRDKGDVQIRLTQEAGIDRSVRLPRNAEAIDAAPKPAVAATARGSWSGPRPLVVGMGPAGLFAALTLARAGIAPVVVERGRPVERRAEDVAAFWAGGPFNPNSNVQFGEGGAGTFSDGKLNSGIHDPRCRRVLEEMHRAGAPESILWQARPHVGTDRLRTMVRNLREEIVALGGDVRFETKLVELAVEGGAVTGARLEGPDGTRELETGGVILAVGHSARDTFGMLLRAGAAMSPKPFAIGARIEHRQAWIDRAQYGPAAGHPALGAADYKLAVHLPDGRSVYTFCMCPGGQVVAAASEDGGVVVNGMSLYARDGENANSALLVNVGPEDFGGDDPLAGVRFQQRWERAAFEAGGGNWRAPAQRVGDFLANRASAGPGQVTPSYCPGVRWTGLDGCLPGFVTGALREALPLLDRKLRGFSHPDAVLTGVETRSSSPVRIVRDDACQSNLRGLYPCGEGAGYAGGIMSAAVDGMRCAEAVVEGLGIRD